MLIFIEGIHGFLVGNATIFNSPIAYGCAFDPKVKISDARVLIILLII